MHRGHILLFLCTDIHRPLSIGGECASRDPKFSNGRPIIVIFDFVNVSKFSFMMRQSYNIVLLESNLFGPELFAFSWDFHSQ